MDDKMINEKVVDIIQSALGKIIDFPAVRLNLAEWDSVKHIEIIMMVEETFNISFGFEEIQNISSSDEIIKLIKDKRNASNF